MKLENPLGILFEAFMEAEPDAEYSAAEAKLSEAMMGLQIAISEHGFTSIEANDSRSDILLAAVGLQGIAFQHGFLQGLRLAQQSMAEG